MSSKLQSQVAAFMKEGGQSIEPVPTIPSRKTVALRVNLVIEEAVELLEACYGQLPEKQIIIEMVRNVTLVREPRVDLAEAADAFGDLDFVSEGGRLAFGIEGESVADAIFEANMKKLDGKRVELVSGKIGKPSQWQKPDIEGVLFKQNSGGLPSVGDRLRELELLKAFHEAGEEMQKEEAERVVAVAVLSEDRPQTHCMRDPAAVGCCAGPGACSCECNTCLCPLCGENPCECDADSLEGP